MFKLKTFDKLQIVSCPNDVDLAATVSFEKTMQQLQQSELMVTVFDFSETQTLAVENCRIFVKLKQDMSANGKIMASIKVPLKIILQMKKAGLEAVFQPFRSLPELCSKLNITMTKNAKIDVRLINPFIQAVNEYFNESKVLTPKMKAPRVKQAEDNIPNGLIGSINLVNSKFSGSLRAIFETSVALTMFNALNGTNKTAMDDDLIAFFGDFLKSIFDKGLVLLKANGHEEILDAYPAIYEIANGRNVGSSDMEVTIVLDFEINIGNFSIEIVSNA